MASNAFAYWSKPPSRIDLILSTMLLLDTLPLIDFFKMQSETVKNIILDSEQGKIESGISVVTLSELFYILADFRGVGFAKTCVDNIKVHL